jgi:hypothetical protein
MLFSPRAERISPVAPPARSPDTQTDRWGGRALSLLPAQAHGMRLGQAVFDKQRLLAERSIVQLSLKLEACFAAPEKRRPKGEMGENRDARRLGG